MSEQYFGCSCGFKCVENQLMKTQGACPKCGRRTTQMRSKYADENVEQTNFHSNAVKVN